MKTQIFSIARETGGHDSSLSGGGIIICNDESNVCLSTQDNLGSDITLSLSPHESLHLSDMFRDFCSNIDDFAYHSQIFSIEMGLLYIYNESTSQPTIPVLEICKLCSRICHLTIKSFEDDRNPVSHLTMEITPAYLRLISSALVSHGEVAQMSLGSSVFDEEVISPQKEPIAIAHGQTQERHRANIIRTQK